MKKSAVFLSLIFLILSFSFAEESDTLKKIEKGEAPLPEDPPVLSEETVEPAEEKPAQEEACGPENLRKIENHAWQVGEKLKFNIYKWLVKGGETVMAVEQTLDANGFESYKVSARVKSTGLIDFFYKVRDTTITFIEKKGIFSLGTDKKLNEGSFHDRRTASFYPCENSAKTFSKRKKNSKEEYKSVHKDLPTYLQDILSSIYFLRTQDLEVGQDEKIEVFDDEKQYQMTVKVHKKEKVKTKAGKFTCYKVEPLLQSTGIFNAKGRLLVWLTDDKRKLPVKLKTKIALGNVQAELVSFEGAVDK
ncbi:MAG: DUF3108 domain-containing protein [Fibrobacterota bacterium]